ncbi:Glucanosyltransferase-domain-containing protein [Apodospora peruviana]|uniref:1,3-beta-glucanosyltransferase n=1 Tax=Apodospora peruviana TaxID=516989 RepID=A0AAE0I4N9_9PEZI|nr:Glucanosyltransferase-domain-containing protein [Apodospora peruviana]
MRSATLVASLAAVVAATPTKSTPQKPRAVSVEPITATGNAFFKGSERFYVRGVAYQPGGSGANIDPLADPKVCLPDIKKFADLGINVVRVYSVDNSKDHKECMTALADADIYVALDANNPKYSINRADPAPSYNADYLQSVFAVIDEFIKYDNTMAFFSGNEVIHDEADTTKSARYVKATTRDMRQYIRERGYRKALVGYSAADVSTNRIQTANYFNCGTEDERSDFFAFNDYSWCDTDIVTSGWDVKVKNFTGYGLPIFLSEYGCTKNGRTFGEIEALMSDQMTPVYSGGLMYEYSMEENKFGIVQISGKDQTGNREELPEYKSLKNALSKYPAPTGDGGFTSTTASAACPTKDSNWLVDSTLLPAMPEKAKVYLSDGAGKGPGLNGPGSQWASTTSSGDAAPGSGSVDSTASPSSAAAGGFAMSPVDRAPFVISGLVAFFTLVGALAL